MMKRTQLKEEVKVFTMNICETTGHEHCPGFTTLSAGEIKLGHVAAFGEATRQRVVSAFIPEKGLSASATEVRQ
jgi:ribosomal protein L32